MDYCLLNRYRNFTITRTFLNANKMSVKKCTRHASAFICSMIQRHSHLTIEGIIIKKDRHSWEMDSGRNDKVVSTRNVSGRSTAKYINQPNEENWIHEGEDYKGEPARQCAAEDMYSKWCVECETTYAYAKLACPECGSKAYTRHRCPNIAEPVAETCHAHAGGKTITKAHADKLKAASITTGFNLADILFCTKTCILAEICTFREQLVDVERYGSPLPRCLPEQQIYDAIQNRFKTEYELDDVADQVMLDSLAMAIVRRARGNKILAMRGELVDRVKTAPDGSYETWQEANPISGVVDSLDKRVQAWLKELAVSKAAREGKKVNVNGTINLLNVLSQPITKDGISEDQIIDIELED